jgi:uncharacterized membrane protein
MFDFIYQFLEKVGFTHPLHPAMTHIPVGMVIGGFLFALAAFLSKKQNLWATAHHCYILAALSVLPTVMLGVMDWQYKFRGEWSYLIILKIIMACVLTALLLVAIKFGKPGENKSNLVKLVIYAACLVAATSLGFLGGELQYG